MANETISRHCQISSGVQTHPLVENHCSTKEEENSGGGAGGQLATPGGERKFKLIA